MEILLRLLQDLVALVLGSVCIGAGVLVALGNVRLLRHPLLRLITTPVLVIAGFSVFYIGIRHMVAG